MAPASRRRPSRKQVVLDQGLEQRDGITYPTLMATWAVVDPVELEAAHRRAQQLLNGGWGAVRW